MQIAITTCRLYGIPNAVIHQALKIFSPLKHRLQLVGEFHGIRFFDDAISTTPESTIAAIRAISNIDTMLLGGKNRGYFFEDLVNTLEEYKINNIVLFPDSGNIIKEIIDRRATYNPAILETRNMEDAVKFAYKATRKGSACVLSTASPSYGVWKNFEEKGDIFQQLVLECGLKCK